MSYTPNPNRVRAGSAIDRQARENFVYWIFDSLGRVLYIGCTRTPQSRWKAHRYINPGLAKAAARFKMAGPYTRAAARAIEKSEIREHDPLFNLELNPHAKRELVYRLNNAAREADLKRVADRYGLEATA